jgi:hypothetical protein
MAVMDRDKSLITQNVVKNVRDWDRFIQKVRRYVQVLDVNTVLHVRNAKQWAGNEPGIF